MGKVIDINEANVGPEIEGKCNVVRKGKRCTKGAGWGTDHVGWGPCKHHMGSTPAVSQHAHKEAAIHYAQTLASELDLNPVEALLWAVRLGAGAVSYWQGLLADENTPIELALAVEQSYGAERDRMAKTAALCIQAGLAEKRVRIAERQADLMEIVLESAMEENGISQAKIEAVKKSAAKHLLALPGMVS